MSTAFQDLLRLSEARVRGPSPSFGRAQFLFAFLTIGDARIIGRQTLARRSGLGEGAVRTVLKKLSESGYLAANASGCHLTAVGVGVYKNLKRKLSDPVSLKDSRLTVGRSQVAVAVRGGGSLVKGGIEQRDSAVKAGASGATTYVIRNGKFTVPGGSLDCEREFPSAAWRTLRGDLNPRDSDAVILCGSSDEMKATLGALSAALTLL